MLHGSWLMAHGSWLMAPDPQLMAHGVWPRKDREAGSPKQGAGNCSILGQPIASSVKSRKGLHRFLDAFRTQRFSLGELVWGLLLSKARKLSVRILLCCKHLLCNIINFLETIEFHIVFGNIETNTSYKPKSLRCWYHAFCY